MLGGSVDTQFRTPGLFSSTLPHSSTNYPNRISRQFSFIIVHLSVGCLKKEVYPENMCMLCDVLSCFRTLAVNFVLDVFLFFSFQDGCEEVKQGTVELKPSFVSRRSIGKHICDLTYGKASFNRCQKPKLHLTGLGHEV